MNVEDVTPIDVSGLGLGSMFARQRELMEKYHEIEVRNGSGYARYDGPVPVNLDLREAQILLKDFAWRVTEELTESLESVMLGDSAIHAQEEAADALHFLLELMILSGLTGDHVTNRFGPEVAEDEHLQLWWLNDPVVSQDPTFWSMIVVLRLGQAMNCLKQKPWKTTHVLTDHRKYRMFLWHAFMAFPNFAQSVGISSAQDMLRMYFRKAEVNKFRQRSNY